METLASVCEPEANAVEELSTQEASRDVVLR